MTLQQREISQQLGISRSQFYRAIHKLSDEGLIDWEAPNGLVVTVKVSSDEHNSVTPNEAELCRTELSYAERNSVAPSETPVTPSETPVTTSETPVTPSETQTPAKPASVKASSASSDSYQSFINSLSNTAREKFFNFVREKVKDFKAPINDLEAWLAGSNGAGKERFRVYYAMFQTEVEKAAAPSQDWENHPQRDEWIAQIRQGKGRFVAQGGPRSEWEKRQAFAEWAIANNLVWGNKP